MTHSKKKALLISVKPDQGGCGELSVALLTDFYDSCTLNIAKTMRPQHLSLLYVLAI